MTEQEMRQLVREAIARAGIGAVGRVLSEPAGSTAAVGRVLLDPAGRTAAVLLDPANPSFALLNLPAGADSDGPCIIEPSVACNRCGYCKTYGH